MAVNNNHNLMPSDFGIHIAAMLKDETLLKKFINLPNIKSLVDLHQWNWTIETLSMLYERFGEVPTLDMIQRELKKAEMEVSEKGSVENFLDVVQLKLNEDFNTQYVVDELQEIVRLSVVKSTITEISHHITNGDMELGELEAELGLSNPFAKANNGKLPTRFTPEEWMAIDQTKLIEETSLINGAFFCRNEILCLLAGPGDGKSVMVNQMAFAWANGKDALGWTPNEKKPLKVLLVQCEDFGQKNSLMFGSIMKRIPSSNGNVYVINERFTNYKQMTSELVKVCRSFKPDVIIVNPLYKYISSEKTLKDDNTINPFLKELEQIINEFNCGCLVVHHLKKDLSAGYGSGMLDWAFRAVVLLERMKQGHYRFRVDKKISESGVIHNQLIKWSTEPGDLYWLVSDEQECDLDESTAILKHLNRDDGVKLLELATLTGIAKSTLDRRLKLLEKQGYVCHGASGYKMTSKEYNPFINYDAN